MKNLKFIFVLVALFTIPFVFNSCSDDDDDSLKDIDVCDAFGVYEGQTEDADGKYTTQTVVSYSNSDKRVYISVQAQGKTNIPILSFTMDDLTIQDQTVAFSTDGKQAIFTKPDQVNLTLKATDSNGKSYTFSGVRTTGDDDAIEKPDFCGMGVAGLNVYITYIGTVHPAEGKSVDNVKIQVSRVGNTMVIKSLTLPELTTATFNLTDFYYKDKNYTYEKDGEKLYFYSTSNGTACGLTIKGTNGVGYSFLGATWNPY